MSKAKSYRKKAVTVKAIHFDGENGQDVMKFTKGKASFVTLPTPHLVIHTLEGAMRADKGDYVICGVKGEFYPCKPDIFQATYEAAE